LHPKANFVSQPAALKKLPLLIMTKHCINDSAI